MRDSIDNEFVSEGINRYAQALDTIAAFETMLGERLREVVKAYSFKHFTPTKTQATSDSGQGAAGRWVWAVQQGKLKSKGMVFLEIGVWWADGEIAFYCCFCDDAGKALPFVYKGKNTRITFKRWGNGPRLFLQTTKDRYNLMKEEFDLVVGELAGAFAA